MTIDVLLPVYNGMPYLPELISSVQAQTHRDWRLWVLDDGSSDGSRDAVRTAARNDPRIRPVSGCGTRLGAQGAFGWLLERAGEGDAEYTMFCDQDDVWLPDKMERTLVAMRDGEALAGRGVPVLVHTDLEVVDENLTTLDPSFWHYQGIRPGLNSVNRLLVQNTVTGCTAMLNQPLRRLGTPVPPEAIMHDWWFALVASMFGRIVSVPVPTILYRQHGRNDIGARPLPRGVDVLRRGLRALRSRAHVRTWLRGAARQAAALHAAYGERLSEDTRARLSRFAEIPECGPFRRRWRFVRLGARTHQGLMGDISLVLRI